MNVMTRFRAAPACALATVLLAGCGTSPERARTWPSWLRECTQAGLPARCGTVERPEAPSLGGGRALSLRVVVLPDRPSNPSSDPIVVLSGGPGQAATEMAGAMSPRFE